MNTNQLHLLEKQLDLFRKIREVSEALIQDGEKFSLDAVIDLINQREPWIESLRSYDEDIKRFNSADDSQSRQLRLEISQYAQALAEIDKKILVLMQEKKSYMLKNMTRNVDNNAFSRQKRAMDQMKPKFVDIQE